MWLFIRKWWVLKRLRREIAIHSNVAPLEQVADGRGVLLSEKAFISGFPNNPEYPGIAEVSIKRFSKVLWWRRKPNERKLKKRMNEYFGMYKSLLQEEYITKERAEYGGEMPSVANPLADSIYGWWGLAEGLLTKYKTSWSIIIIPLLLGAYGSPLIRSLIHRLITGSQ